ncbi:MAG: MATE family multidrug resistance protein [Paraglaciecola sp.]
MAHKRIFLLALPMILSNITTPLIGMVDTAVLGHMPGSQYLAGSAIAGLIITQLYWLCGFIRMSSTGLSAQAKGQNNPHNASKALYQSLVIALLIAALILMVQGPLLSLGLYFADSSPEVVEVVQDYFQIRILGAPAALANLALIGWLIGQQQTKQVLLIQVIANLLNAGLSITLVFVLGMGVSGVAGASVVAEYFIFASSLYFALQMPIPRMPQSAWLKFKELKSLLVLNSHTFMRNLILQLCIAFLVLQGAKMGPLTAATNAILMQFFTLIALGLDGIAYAVEALVGEAKGKSSQLQITLVTLGGLFYSAVVAILYSLLFAMAGSGIITLLSDQVPLQAMATGYLPIIWLLPLVAHWCFLLDGVFVGLTRAKAMQNSMLLSSLVFYVSSWFLLPDYGNWGLWLAMLIFMLARGLILGLYFTYLHRKGLLLA